MDAGTLSHALSRLSNTARVLYVAAHPDDENTRLLTYLANARHVTVAYLSMTRGGGGQNLIGREQEELLDVIRTQELLAARSLDGAHQRFTRMRDFGYSKSADETLSIWGHDEALADVVWVMRTFQPDVVVTRFDEKPPNHGHHTASAILAREAFEAAADPRRFPEQLTRGARTWQPKRLVLNVPHWRKEPLPEGALSLDVGGYDPRLGLSYGELAARSRTQHKSQGFGVQGERGALIESFLPVLGERPKQDLLEGVEPSFARFGDAGAAVDQALAQARKRLHRDVPERALPALLQAKRALESLPQQVRQEARVRDAEQALSRVIAGASGLFARATAARPSAVAGQSVPLRVELVMRRPAGMSLEQLAFPDGAVEKPALPLPLDQKHEVTHALRIAADAPVSTPYWLAEPSLPGRQVLRDPQWLGSPEGPPPLSVQLTLSIGTQRLQLSLPVLHASNDRVHGERVRTFQVVPPATLTPVREAVMFPNGRAAPVVLRVQAGQDELSGEVQLNLPAGYRASPAVHSVALAHAGDEMTVRFEVTPPKLAKGAQSLQVQPTFTSGGRAYAYRQDDIDYPHIPPQSVLRPAKVKLSSMPVSLPKGPIGYVDGSGDTVGSDLAHLGASVVWLDDAALRSGNLARFSAIVLGIRAYNTRAVLRSTHARLMRYVEEGGTLVVQYNTHSSYSPLELSVGPYPLELGRERVTNEHAAMTAIDARHPLLNKPHKLTAADYDGWVQERGLYFASKWDERYQPVFELADPGEGAARGSVLVARHGRGRYVYTGLSFFRQLPAGVPGAYRLLLNLLSR